MLPQIGKLLIIFGVSVLIIGLILLFFDRIPLLGKLPGDFNFKLGGTQVYFPVATCLILSTVLTVILNLVSRWR